MAARLQVIDASLDASVASFSHIDRVVVERYAPRGDICIAVYGRNDGDVPSELHITHQVLGELVAAVMDAIDLATDRCQFVIEYHSALRRG